MTKAERKKIQQANAAKAREAKAKKAAIKKAAAEVIQKEKEGRPDPELVAVQAPWRVEVDEWDFSFYVNGCLVAVFPRFPVVQE